MRCCAELGRGRTGLEGVIALHDGLHLLLLGITVERRVTCLRIRRRPNSEATRSQRTAKQEVGDHTHGPDIHRLSVAR